MASPLTICNMALVHLGESARVTSIAPSDGSVQADLCARFYPQADVILRTAESWLLTDDSDRTSIAVQSVVVASDSSAYASIYAVAVPEAAEDERVGVYDFAKSWLLASMLAGPILKGDVGASQEKICLSQYAFWKGQALLLDARLRSQTAVYVPSSVAARA